MHASVTVEAKSSFINHKCGKAMHWQNNGNPSQTVTNYINGTHSGSRVSTSVDHDMTAFS